MKRFLAIPALTVLTAVGGMAATVDRAAYFACPSVKETPLRVETLSEKVENGIRISEIKFDGGPVNGKPTRCYAWYTRPDKPGKFPGLVVVHGAGLEKLNPNLTYPKQGFATLAIDWAGPSKGRKTPRRPPYSEFESQGALATPVNKKWTLHPIPGNHLQIGVRFVRRAVEFLRNRPEVDASRIGSVGSSAGAHLSLLFLGVEPNIKAAVVKYGTGFIRDIPGSYGGYFGPVTLCPAKDQDAWLEHFDPKHGIPNYRAKVLLISGTDDIFFWFRNVLMTYRNLPGEKRLLVRPNDNHKWVGNDPVSGKFLLDALNHARPLWPNAPAPAVTQQDGKCRFTVTPPGAELKNVELIWKTMDRGFFHHAKNWKHTPMVRDGKMWKATLDTPKPDQQLVAYAILHGSAGELASTDTVEIPESPSWRGDLTRNVTLADGNLILNSSFDKYKSMNWARLGGPRPEWTDQAGAAHSGTGAIRMPADGMPCLRTVLMCREAGTYRFRCMAKKSTEKPSELSVRISVAGKMQEKKFKLTDSYMPCETIFSVPTNTPNVAVELWCFHQGEALIDDVSVVKLP